MSSNAAAATPAQGHPPGLYMLFFAELWERFCYYGMRALLVLYMTDKALGFGYEKPRASLTYGAYCSLVYATGIFGGYVADRVLGYRIAIILGGLLMAIGDFCLLARGETWFYTGLATIVVGNGMFKPNISTLVGKLYSQGDPRKDSAFTIFYMGINIGALIAPLICGWVAKEYGWNYGFGAAGVGMMLGVVVFGLGGKLLQGQGGAPENVRSIVRNVGLVVLVSAVCVPAATWLLKDEARVMWLLVAIGAAVLLFLLSVAFRSERVQRDQLLGLIFLLLANMFFWAFFEQAGSSLNLFARDNVNRMIGGWEFPTAWFQSVNSAFIVALAPLFTALWLWLNRAQRNPSIPVKFSLALLQAGLGYLVLVWSKSFATAAGVTPFVFLVLTYMLHTTGELCISPVGLSTMTKLAPKSIAGMVMGAWFLSISLGNYLAGVIASWTGSDGGGKEPTGMDALVQYTSVYQQGFYFLSALGIAMLLLSRPLNKLLHGVK